MPSFIMAESCQKILCYYEPINHTIDPCIRLVHVHLFNFTPFTHYHTYSLTVSNSIVVFWELNMYGIVASVHRNTGTHV